MRHPKTWGVLLATTLLPGLAWSGSTDVLMQGFHWNSAAEGGWYNTVKSKAPELGAAGINHVWLPPPSKAESLEGYLPQELNVLDSAYGSEQQLRDAISALHAAGVGAVADIVINHRNATGSWHNFQNPTWGTDAITSNDECWYTPGATCQSWMTKGVADTGEPYAAGRDIDHTKQYVRDSIVQWLGTRLAGVGFDGWRFDFVKGYAGGYVGEYVSRTTPTFCVGEHWPTNSFDPNDPANWRGQITGWVDATGNRCNAFDFVTKAMFNTVLANGEYGRLKTADGKPVGTIGVKPGHSVTFVDNHDTGPSGACGSGQNHWPVPCDKVMPAYAYILTHSGTPSIYWAHYYNWNLKAEINTLISIRKTSGLHSESVVNIVKAEQGLYAAIIDDKVAMKIGPNTWSPGTGWTLAASGNQYAVWTKGSQPPPTGCTFPSLNLRGTFNAWGNQAMTCKGGNMWEVTGISFSGAPTDRFKFDVYGDWTQNYGDTNQDGYADQGGADISVGAAGTYKVTFNDSTRQYTVTLEGTPPPPGGASVHFSCQNGTTYMGQDVYVVGSLPELGSWNPAQAVKLDPNAYPTWDKLVALPASTLVEWKCIKQAPGAAVVWHSGANNVVTTPASGTVNATASF